MLETKTRGENATMKLGEELGLILAFPCVIILTGDLGAGKTTFTKGLGRGLGVLEDVNSPSFNILNIYQGRLPFYHFDFYRLEDSGELWNIGFEEYLYSDGVALVEWGNKFPEVLPEEFLEIKFTSFGDLERDIIFVPHGNYPHVLEREMRSYVDSRD